MVLLEVKLLVNWSGATFLLLTPPPFPTALLPDIVEFTKDSEAIVLPLTPPPSPEAKLPEMTALLKVSPENPNTPPPSPAPETLDAVLPDITELLIVLYSHPMMKNSYEFLGA